MKYNEINCRRCEHGLHDAQRGKRKMGRFVPTDKLLLHRWTHPRCCQDGNNLADPERRGKAGGWQDEKRQGG